MGTDEAGRDVLSRIIIGARVSLPFALVIVLTSMAFGMPLGLIAGMFGGKLDNLIMRLADIWIAIPQIIFALAIAAFLGPSLINSVIAIAFCAWPWHARFIRAEVLHIREETYVEVAQSIGASRLYVAVREVLPNAFIPYIVKITTDLGYAILLLATLGFLGLGAQPPTPEWGTIAGAGRTFLPEIWWISLFPGVAIFLTVLAFNVVGDGLRNTLGVEEM
jgi:peptide/nickel transport system permease protein